MVANTLLPVGRVLDTQTRKSEHIIAIPNQTVFTLLTALYQPGFNTLDVYVNGLKKETLVDFIESTSSIVTFNIPMLGGESLEFVSNIILNNGVAYTNLHSFGAGAAAPVTQANVTQAVATAMAQPTLRPATGTAGLTQVFGNNGGWEYATGGGSRVFLGKVDATNAATPFSYQLIDLSDSAHISFDVNIDTLPAGVVFASYLVPMKTNMATSLSPAVMGNTVLSSGIAALPQLADEWGIGYGDAQGVNTIYTPEVDIFEASGVGAQFTLHGYDRSGAGLSSGGVDNPGVWNSIHGLYVTEQYPPVLQPPKGVYDAYSFGAGTQFTINTQKSIHVDATFIGPANVAGIADALTMTVIISQGANSITKTVTSLGFTIPDLQKMVYTSSIWATDTVVSATDTTQTSNTWWLDGVVDKTTASITDQRGWILPSGKVPSNGTLPLPAPVSAPIGISNPMFLDYNSYSTQMSFYIKTQDIPNARNQRPVASRSGNLQFDMVDTLGTAIIPTATMAWVLDVKYRGVVNTTTPMTHINFWSGRYNASYGVYTEGVSDTVTATHIKTSNLIPSMLPNDATPPVFSAYVAGIGSVATAAMIPPTIAALQAAISTSSSASYIENITNVSPLAVTATIPWNYIPADNIGIQSYSATGITTTQTLAISASSAHIQNMQNPHNTTKAQVGLANVPNTDFTTPISLNTAKVGITPTQTADILLNNAKVSDVNHVASLLPNVNNTSDANKPVSTAQAAAIGLKINTSQKGVANGVAGLDATNELTQNPAGTASQVAAGAPSAVKLADGTWGVGISTGGIGNINSPLVHIPFKRANDEVALSGAQTFTRASTATYIDPLDGLVKTAAPNEMRFERMSDGGTGVLLEGVSTNVILHSNMQSAVGFNQANWTVGNTTTAPDGTIIEGFTTNINNSVPYITKSALLTSPVGGRTFTYSVWIKGSGLSVGKNAKLFFFIGSIFFTKGVILTASWQRLTFTSTGTVGDIATSIQGRIDIISSNVDPVAGNDVVYCWGMQIEELPFTSSYIPTTTTAVTRTADHLSIPFSGNAPRFDLAHNNPMSLAMDVELIQWNSVLFQHIMSSSAQHEYFFRNQSGSTLIFGGFNDVACYLPSISQGTHRLAVSISADKSNIKGYVDGISGSNGAISNNSNGSAHTIYIGSWNVYSYPMYGHIRNFRIYDRALTASEIAAA